MTQSKGQWVEARSDSKWRKSPSQWPRKGTADKEANGEAANDEVANNKTEEAAMKEQRQPKGLPRKGLRK